MVSSAVRHPVDVLVQLADWDCRRREAMVLSLVPNSLPMASLFTSQALVKALLGLDYEDALVLDLSGSDNSWDQVRFAVRSRSEGLPSPDLIIGAWMEVPDRSCQIGPFVLRSTSECFYRPVVVIDESSPFRPFSHQILAGAFAIVCLLDHSDLGFIGPVNLDCLWLRGAVSEPKLLSIDARSATARARTLLSEFKVSFLFSATSSEKIPDLSDIPNRPHAACLSGCVLSVNCVPAPRNPILLDEHVFPFFEGFSSVDQALRALEASPSDYDPPRLMLARAAAFEYATLTAAMIAEK